MNPSTSDSFFFQICPNYFKVEHAFAKIMKSGSTYRLVIYKGIQKIEEMAQGIKGRLVGGRILFEPVFLSFALPNYSPMRKIEFTMKIYETKPNEPETELAQHKIKAADYIKTHKEEGNSTYKEEVQLIDSFALNFDLFIHSSRKELDLVVKEHQSKLKHEGRNKATNNRTQTPTRNDVSDNLSQSDTSEYKEGGALNSKRKLSRRRGHEGKFKSKNESRQNSDAGSSRDHSVRSSRKPIGNFTSRDNKDHFIKTQRKEQDDNSPQKSEPPTGKTQNFVSVARRDSNASEITKTLPSPGRPVKVQSNFERTELDKKQHFRAKFHDLANDFPVIRQPIIKRQESSKSTQNATSRPADISIQQPSFKNLNNQPTSPKGSVPQAQQPQLSAFPQLKFKPSTVRRSIIQSPENLPQEQAKRQFQSTKDKLFYFLFFILSSFLFYNAVTPSRRT